MKITIIVPLRVTEGVYQARLRLEQISNNVPADKFNIIIVDYGTPKKFLSTLEGLEKENVSILRYEATKEIFNIGHARDLGVQYSKDDVVMFNDIDFFASTKMYNNIYEEVISRDMHNSGYDFFCVPVFFLSESGTKTSLELNTSNPFADRVIQRKIIEAENSFVEFPAYGSSAIVVNKNHYLGIGGHSREFFGHGAEDYDVLHRLSSYYSKGPRTADYYIDTKSNDIKNYRGFRAFFALYGIDIFSKGIFFLHQWHPKRIIPGYHQSKRNFALLENLMVKFDRTREQPLPLSNLSSTESSLVLLDTKSQTFKAIRHALPSLGQMTVLSESDFTNPDELINFIETYKIDKVLLLNPYGNEHRLSLYRELRNQNKSYLVFDRGALPDSWFFDPNGFNYDSKSYHPDAWDKPLTQEQDDEIEEYLFNLRNSEETLEHNAARKSARYLREFYQVGNRKILFVPFQRPTDTVTTYFAGPAESVYEFQNWVQFIANNLSKSEWVIICKNHPLEKELPKVDGVIYADNDAHIHDLISACDKVFLMNSGVGLIAQAFGKPVVCSANAFYAHDGIAFPVESKEEALKKIKSKLKVSQEKINRFYWHIIKNVYSFGQSKYRKTKAADGTDRNIVQEIIFEDIRLGERKIHLGSVLKGVTLDAPLFASFGGRDGIKNALKKPAPAVKTTPPVSKPSLATNKQITPQNKATPKNSTENMPTAEIITLNKSQFRRKLNKLVNTPSLFIKDAFINKKHRSTQK
ncbi:hypothetical protein AB6880_08910 [Rahnella inusitata]|uniref:capsular polysaccharide export protein, LipB/KpsS family n=1 Tax=Rahnella inusitata TaxID=58169 RepID=UPI0039BEC7CD